MGVLPIAVWSDSYITPDKNTYELLESLECPDHLDELELYVEEVWNAFEWVHERNILLHLEQSCDLSGRLLSADIRQTKLQTAPLEELQTLEMFINQTADDVLNQVAYLVFWLVRLDRAESTGNAELIS